ncbi:hypothetical protein AORI_3296 [Amycolatopsis keratiniphila]|uniref:Uncharacterized protein n=1 Tax=Amycolatopsis keratiniphila TaxID=129921 RepID=R4T0E8_9PSEU|nr:hypothetical protein AORI_3296 [Amycolatopsis keratiniphila]
MAALPSVGNAIAKAYLPRITFRQAFQPIGKVVTAARPDGRIDRQFRHFQSRRRARSHSLQPAHLSVHKQPRRTAGHPGAASIVAGRVLPLTDTTLLAQ